VTIVYLEISNDVSIYTNEAFQFQSWTTTVDKQNEIVLLVGGSSELIVFQNGDLNVPFQKRIQSELSTRRNCERAGTNPVHCKNFIQNILACDENNDVLFCGTNAFKPLLYSASLDQLGENKTIFTEHSGIGLCPSSPTTSRQANKITKKTQLK